MSPFGKKNNNNNNSNENSIQSSPAAVSPSSSSNAFSSSPTSQQQLQQQQQQQQNTSPVTATSISEVALLLKHHSTFETMQTFMADLLAAATSASALSSNSGGAIPLHIHAILRESGIPQLLERHFGSASAARLRSRCANRGLYATLLEKCQKKLKNQTSSINLDVVRTCASHPYFSAGPRAWRDGAAEHPVCVPGTRYH